MRRWPRPRPALARGSTFTTQSALTKASVTARRARFTRKACGYVDDRTLPTGCASPAFQASLESGEMLAFAHIPIATGEALERRMECNLKPFEVTQRVRHPPGRGAARQPEASLAWVA